MIGLTIYLNNMKHKLIEIDDRTVYVMNIPAYDDEGTLSTQDAVILRLHERLLAMNQYIEDNGLEPYQTPREIAQGAVKRLVGRAKKLLNIKND